MKKTTTLLCIFLAITLLATSFLYFNHSIGTSAKGLETHARKSQRIGADWSVENATSDTLSAMLFYAPNQQDSVFSLYVNRPKLSFGYFFQAGGIIATIEQRVAECFIDGYTDRVLVSMNKEQINKMEYEDRTGFRTVEIDSEKPFAYILTRHDSNITLYDVHGNVVDIVPCKY